MYTFEPMHCPGCAFWSYDYRALEIHYRRAHMKGV